MSSLPCVQVVNGTTVVCSQPNSYVFWDSFHFTTTFNALAATYASDLIMSTKSVANVIDNPMTVATSTAPHLRVSFASTISLICALLVALLHYAL